MYVSHPALMKEKSFWAWYPVPSGTLERKEVEEVALTMIPMHSFLISVPDLDFGLCSFCISMPFLQRTITHLLWVWVRAAQPPSSLQCIVNGSHDQCIQTSWEWSSVSVQLVRNNCNSCGDPLCGWHGFITPIPAYYITPMYPAFALHRHQLVTVSWV